MISADYALDIYDNDLPTHGPPGRNFTVRFTFFHLSRGVVCKFGQAKLIMLAHLDCQNLDRGDPESEEPAYKTCVRRSTPKISVCAPVFLVMIPQTSSPHHLACSPHLRRRTETLFSSHPKSPICTHGYALFPPRNRRGSLANALSLDSCHLWLPILPTNLSPLCQFKKRCG
jgi:hypothetical protein